MCCSFTLLVGELGWCAQTQSSDDSALASKEPAISSAADSNGTPEESTHSHSNGTPDVSSHSNGTSEESGHYNGTSKEDDPKASKGLDSFKYVSEAQISPYVVKINGNIPLNLLNDLTRQSSLIQEKDKTLAGVEMARKRTEEDKALFETICSRMGYFDAEIRIQVTQDGRLLGDEPASPSETSASAHPSRASSSAHPSGASSAIHSPKASSAPASENSAITPTSSPTLFSTSPAPSSDVPLKSNTIMITFDVDVGQRYTISQKVLDKNDDDGAYVDNHDPFTDLEQKEYTTVVEGECVDFSKIMSTKNRIVSALQNKGYYFASANNPRVDIDRSTKQATVTFSYTCGMQTMVSDVQVCGEGNVPKSFILKRVSLVKGAILKPFNVSHSQKDLFNSGLFSEVNIYATKDGGGSNNNGSNSLLTSSPKYDNAVVHIDVVPAPPRTVGASAYIAASEGGMLAVTWNHKNFLKRALDVGTVLRISSKEASAVAYLNKPDAFRRCQDLHTDVAFRRFNTLAYDGDKTSLTVGLVQRPKHTKHRLTLAFLPTLEHANLKRSDVGVKQTICGASINVRLNTANRDNAPTAGFIFDLSCQPYFGKFTNLSQSAEVSSTNVMGIFTGSIKGYVPLGKGDGDSPNLTNVASFLSLGRISISDFNCIPLDKRFYGGGRDSIRAYGYQLCGELDSDDRPVGGGTLLELCIEPRIRLSENFSSVVFFETSRVYRSAVQPKSLYGMGIGVRYFTRFGPIRFDIAFPFERRTSNKDTSKRIDRRFQFYISVGQSF